VIRAALAALLLLALGCRSTPRPPSPVGRALRDRRAGDEAREGGSPAAAASLYQRAAAEAQATDRRDLAADALYRLGLSRLSAGQPGLAERVLESAAAEAERAAAPRLAARAYLALARARQELGSGEVEEALELARTRAEAARDPVARALALVGLAALADPAGAGTLLDQAEAVAGGEAAVRCPLALQRAARAERDGAPAGPPYRAAVDACAGREDYGALHLALSGAARAALAEPGEPAALDAADLFRRAAAAALAARWREQAQASLRAAAEALRRAGRGTEAEAVERELPGAGG